MFPPICNTIPWVQNHLPPLILPISWIRKRSHLFFAHHYHIYLFWVDVEMAVTVLSRCRDSGNLFWGDAKMAATILSRCRDGGNLFWVDVEMVATILSRCRDGGNSFWVDVEMAATILSRCRDGGNLFWVDVKMGAWCNFGGKKYITVYFFPGEPTFLRRVLVYFQKNSYVLYLAKL